MKTITFETARDACLQKLTGDENDAVLQTMDSIRNTSFCVGFLVGVFVMGFIAGLIVVFT